MCAGPFFPGTVNRKKSPKPTRYMRTRMLPLPPVTEACVPPGAVCGAVVDEAFPAGFRAEGLDLEEAGGRAFRWVLAAAFRGWILAALAFFRPRLVLLMHQTEVGLEVREIFGVTYREPFCASMKSRCLSSRSFALGPVHSFADGETHRRSFLNDFLAVFCQFWRRDDKRDTCSERK